MGTYFWAEEMDLHEFFEAEGSVLFNHGKEGHSESKVWYWEVEKS